MKANFTEQEKTLNTLLGTWPAEFDQLHGLIPTTDSLSKAKTRLADLQSKLKPIESIGNELVSKQDKVSKIVNLLALQPLQSQIESYKSALSKGSDEISKFEQTQQWPTESIDPIAFGTALAPIAAKCMPNADDLKEIMETAENFVKSPNDSGTRKALGNVLLKLKSKYLDVCLKEIRDFYASQVKKASDEKKYFPMALHQSTSYQIEFQSKNGEVYASFAKEVGSFASRGSISLGLLLVSTLLALSSF